MMKRHSIRLKDYDYSQPATYFVTIAKYKKFKMFGYLDDERMELVES